MTDISSIARPYAQAVFELARTSNDYERWSLQLEALAEISELDDIQGLISNTLISHDQLTDLIIEIAGDNLDSEGTNLVRLLIKNGRFLAARSIFRQYTNMRAEIERLIEAELVTAAPISDEQKQVFSISLEKRLGRTVKLTYQVDKELIGGAVVRAGDWVIDGSVRAQLDKLVGVLGV